MWECLLDDTHGQAKRTEAQFSKSSPGEQPQEDVTEHPTSRWLVISVHGHLQAPQVPARRTLGGGGLSSLWHWSVFPGREGSSQPYFHSQLSTCLLTPSPRAPCCESRRARFLGLHPRSRAAHAGDGGPRGQGLSPEWGWDSRPAPLTRPSATALRGSSPAPSIPELLLRRGGGREHCWGPLWWSVGTSFCVSSQTDSQTQPHLGLLRALRSRMITAPPPFQRKLGNGK